MLKNFPGTGPNSLVEVVESRTNTPIIVKDLIKGPINKIRSSLYPQPSSINAET